MLEVIWLNGGNSEARITRLNRLDLGLSHRLVALPVTDYDDSSPIDQNPTVNNHARMLQTMLHIIWGPDTQAQLILWDISQA
jgi:hypothetical protein